MNCYFAEVGDGMSSKTKKKNQEKNGLFSKPLRAIFTIAAICVFAVIVVQYQGEISRRKTENAILEQKIIAQEMQNQKIQAEIDACDDAEYIERVAREKYGYVMAGETVFVNAN